MDNNYCVVSKGTTPNFIFQLKIGTNTIDASNSYVVFKSGTTEVQKTGTDLSLDNTKMQVACSLTQGESLLFNGSKLNIQLFITMNGDQKLCSRVFQIPCFDTLKGDAQW